MPELMNRDATLRSFATHNGRFHADEVTACALLLLFDLIDRNKIYRTRDPKVINQCEFICDVGGSYIPDEKIFDHHQSGYHGTMSSAGMILAYLRDTRVISHDLYHHLDQELIFGVDAYDNGKELLNRNVATFSHIISNFCPVHYDSTPEEEDETFHFAVDFAMGHLTRLISRFDYIRSCRSLVKERMDTDSVCLFFNEGLPWIDSFFELGGENHPAKFVIMPAGKHWKLRGIPPNTSEMMKVRHPLPSSWAGLLENQLKKVSGIPGGIFCHKGRFISVWETKEDAIKALEIVLKGDVK
ncbi:MYG1 family protein [Chlamydiales bacterium]|nr:MYG1 family protein [Chlamydiales bacterium]